MIAAIARVNGGRLATRNINGRDDKAQPYFAVGVLTPQ